MKQEPEVAHLASVYLKWASLGLPAYAFNSVSRRYFQSQGVLFAPDLRDIWLTPPWRRPIHSTYTHYSRSSSAECIAQLPARSVTWRSRSEWHSSFMYSVGPRAVPSWVHWGADCDGHLVQSHIHRVYHLWSVLRPQNSMAPTFNALLDQSRSSCPAWVVWSRASGQ